MAISVAGVKPHDISAVFFTAQSKATGSIQSIAVEPIIGTSSAFPSECVLIVKQPLSVSGTDLAVLAVQIATPCRASDPVFFILH